MLKIITSGALIALSLTGCLEFSDRVAPKFKAGEHVTVKASDDEAIVTGPNGCSKDTGCTMKIVLLETQIPIIGIHESELMAIGK